MIRQNKINYFIWSIILILLSLAIYLSFIGGYGSDEDTLPMIYVFESKLFTGKFVSSRFTGNPVAEIGIGFLSYFFGSIVTNITTFFLFVLGLIIFYFCLSNNKNINLFLLLCFSSPVLYFDNLEPVDYSWAFFFYAFGLFFFKKKLVELSILFFALSIGVRINFFLFIIFTIFFFDIKNLEFTIKRRVSIIFCTFFIGSLFYLPVWYDSKFQLYWLTAGRPIDEGLLGLVSRFLYKSFYAFGGISVIIILYGFVKKNLLSDNNIYFILSLVLSNLLLFFWIPAELSYLQPAIIFIYYIVIKYFDFKIIIILICVNFMSWIINPQFLNIKYMSDDICEPKHAIDAEFKFTIQEGYFNKFLASRDLINCWAQGDSERSQRIRSGLPLRSK